LQQNPLIADTAAFSASLEAVFRWPLSRASQIRSQQQRQRGWKLYSFHAPEVECIGKAKARVQLATGCYR
jgi:transposase, IS5 family